MDAFEYESLDDFNRVMCWAHVDRATRKRALLLPGTYPDEIMDDIPGGRRITCPVPKKTQIYKKK